MSNKSHFFRQSNGLSLLADYQFNNNLIDDANGYNLTGTNITYNNDSAVFNSSLQSSATRTDANNIFSFTDGVNDLPFRIEINFKLSPSPNQFEFLVSKRQGSNVNCEWALFIDYNNNLFSFILFSGGTSSAYILIDIPFVTSTNTNYNIVVEYDGSATETGLNMVLNGVSATSKIEVGNYVGMSKTGSRFSISQSPFGSDLNAEMDYLKIYKL